MLPGFRTIPLLLSLVVLATSTPPAFARGRGVNPYVRRMMQQQQKWFAQQMQAMQKQQEAEYKVFMARFDTNRNGRIDGKERAPAERYLRKLDAGEDPDAGTRNLNKRASRKSSTNRRTTSSPKEDAASSSNSSADPPKAVSAPAKSKK